MDWSAAHKPKTGNKVLVTEKFFRKTAYGLVFPI